MTRIYIDTNVFLDFYQSTTDRMEIFKQLRERADCIVVPEQTVQEFRRNRAARLTQLAKLVQKSAEVNVYTTSVLRELPDFEAWLKARDSVKHHANVIATQLRDWARDESSDPVYQEFVALYAQGTTMSTPEDALAKAQARKLLGSPPTSPDKHTVCDEVIWETLLELCKDDLIVVSRDHTFVDNEALLRSEFDSEGERRLIKITKSLSEALKLIGKPSPAVELAEKEDRRADPRLQKALQTGICPKCDVEMNEEGFEGGDGDMAWWLTCPKCGFSAYPGPEP